MREILAADQDVGELRRAVAEAIGVARFNAFERANPFSQRDLIATSCGA